MISKIKTALESGEISVKELLTECQSNAQKYADCNMFTQEYYNEALQNAELYQQQLNNGSGMPLCGIPVAVKDNIAYKNHTLTCGSIMLENFVSPYSATALQNLQNAGAIIIGKTNMDEFGIGSHSQNSCFGGMSRSCKYSVF